VTDYVLEPAAAEFADAAAHAPPVYELTPNAARASLEDVLALPKLEAVGCTANQRITL
jgi:acetyl esterase